MRRLLCVFLLILCSVSVQAASIGVSPGRINFENLLRDGYAERTVRITSNSPEVITGHFELRGDLAEWLTFDTNGSNIFSVSSSEPYTLKVIIQPPSDARSDVYTGEIEFVTDHFGTPIGRAGGLVRAAVTMVVEATVSDVETFSCSTGGYSFNDIEIDFPLELAYTLSNTGNVRIEPTVSFTIWDKFQDQVVHSDGFQTPEVLPTVEERFVQQLNNPNLEIGQYWADISAADCAGSALISFSVVEKGGIVDKGVLEGLTSTVWAVTGQPAEIIARFRNVGPRTVSAQFVGTVKLDGRVVEVIETDEVDVEPNQVIDISSFFTPDEIGRYVVNGRVNYNRKITYEKGTIINVNFADEESSSFRYWILFAYLGIIMAIIIMVRKIIRARKSF